MIDKFCLFLLKGQSFEVILRWSVAWQWLQDFDDTAIESLWSDTELSKLLRRFFGLTLLSLHFNEDMRWWSAAPQTHLTNFWVSTGRDWFVLALTVNFAKQGERLVDMTDGLTVEKTVGILVIDIEELVFLFKEG